METYTINYNNSIYTFIKPAICTVKANPDNTYTIALSNATTLSYVYLETFELNALFTQMSPALYMTSDTGNDTAVYVDLDNVCEYSYNDNSEEFYIGLKNSTVKYHYKFSEEFITAVNDYWNNK